MKRLKEIWQIVKEEMTKELSPVEKAELELFERGEIEL